MRTALAALFSLIPLVAQAQSWNQPQNDPYDAGPQRCERSYGGCYIEEIQRLSDQADRQEREDQAYADHFWASTDPSDR